ncbi:hypothetical protein Moror_740 [Moniliophthora roreri MCA 2997]|uniref:Uncharacterized protein n=2 Tax=Moniliophthora roreri TaxID=221103 RepID=V2YE31_MONRO|nr:hypothetical protein Moror_740 [Moniliophthora roreri MCA 2997]
MQSMDPEVFATFSASSFNSLAASAQMLIGSNTTTVAGTTDRSFPIQDLNLFTREYYSSTDPCHPINLPNNILDDEGLVYTNTLLHLHRSLWGLSDEDAQRLGGSIVHCSDDEGKLWKRRLLACGLPSTGDGSDLFTINDVNCPCDISGNLLPQFHVNESPSQSSGCLTQAGAFSVPSQNDYLSSFPYDWSDLVPQLANDASENSGLSACIDVPAVSVAETSPTVVDTATGTQFTVVGGNGDQLRPDCCVTELPVEKTSNAGHRDAVAGSGEVIADSEALTSRVQFSYHHSTTFIDTPQPEPSPFDFSGPPAEPSTGPIRQSPTRQHQQPYENPRASFKFKRTPPSSDPNYIECDGPEGPPICGWTTDRDNQPLSKPCPFAFHDASHDAIQAHLISHLPEYLQDIPADSRGRIKCMWDECKSTRVTYPALVEHVRKQHLAVYWKCKRCGSTVRKGNEKTRHKEVTKTGASRCDIQLRLQEKEMTGGQV